MIDDSIILYLLFMLIMLMINIIGYTKIPFVSLIGLLGTVILAVPTVVAFGDHYTFALILLLLNTMIPVISIISSARGK